MKEETTKTFIIRNAIAIVVMIASLFASYYSIKIDINNLNNKVEANEQKDRVEHSTFVTRDEFQYVIQRLDRIESKLDRVIENK